MKDSVTGGFPAIGYLTAVSGAGLFGGVEKRSIYGSGLKGVNCG
jgi:hypothetical protein